MYLFAFRIFVKLRVSGMKYVEVNFWPLCLVTLSSYIVLCSYAQFDSVLKLQFYRLKVFYRKLLLYNLNFKLVFKNN